MFFRRKKRSQPPMPDWMKWAVVVFLGLAFIGNMNHKNTHTPPISQALNTAANNLSPKKLFPVEGYKNVLHPQALPENKNAAPSLSIKDVTQGTGTQAACGQKATLSYQSYANDGKPALGQTLVLHIGDNSAGPITAEDVIGMKKGGKRTVSSSAGHFDIELLDLTPPIPDAGATPYRISTTTPGNGSPVLCGKAGTFRITLWSMDGKKLFSTPDNQPITFTPGESLVFLGLEQGVIGMKTGEKRTLVVPPDFQKTMDGNLPKLDFPLPKDQTVLVDVVAVP